jgi:hypothetical protein
MTVADIGLTDVWPIAAIAGRGRDIRARFASLLLPLLPTVLG